MTSTCSPATRFVSLTVLLSCILIGLSALGQNTFTLPPGCTLPFDKIATRPDPFVKCGNCGAVSRTEKGTALQAKVLQNQAKNNFCADASKLTVVDFTTLRTMGTNASQQGLEKTDLPSRQKLHNFFTVNGTQIGEGDVVRLKAWMLEAHVSDCDPPGELGEEVNCETLGFANNDLHIPLLDPAGNRNQDECTSVTAEISPHFRPATWSALDLKTPVKNVVRVTGPLFYDNAHRPCVTPNHTDKGNEAPFRSTIWEIHPVYQLEVCANVDATNCDVTSTDTSVWIPYDQWIADARNQQATSATGASQRKKCTSGTQKSGFVAAKCPK